MHSTECNRDLSYKIPLVVVFTFTKSCTACFPKIFSHTEPSVEHAGGVARSGERCKAVFAFTVRPTLYQAGGFRKPTVL